MGKGKGYFSDYPKCVFFILGNEFCERFSFYGMKAILVIYLTRALSFSSNDSTSIYHGFNMACYFMPLFGAMIADGWLGKYWTIFSISILYAIGNAVMAMTAFPPESRIGMWFALLLIAIGTGGIKPCVSAFGGDQFETHQTRQQESFFSVFYMSINLGSLFSMILTPILRSEVKCFGKDCYPLAFGVPAALMFVALVFFIIGTRWYKRYPPQGNIIGDMFGCIGRAIKNKCKSHEKQREHWLFYADDKYSKDFLVDVRAVLRVLFMFLPLPVFWALFDQQGSRWTLQAGRMNGDLGGGVVFQPDQIQAINPILIIVMVPILESVIFPCLNKLRIPNSPLQRLGVGMILAALAFIVAAVLQVAIENTSPKALDAGKFQFKAINTLPCDVNVTSLDYKRSWMVKSEQASGDIKLDFTKPTITVRASSTCGGDNSTVLTVEDKTIYSFVISPSGNKGHDMTAIKQDRQVRTLRGRASVRVMNALHTVVDVDVVGTSGQAGFDTGRVTPLNSSEYKDLTIGTYAVRMRETGRIRKLMDFTSRNGRVSTIVIYGNASHIKSKDFEDLSKNSVNIFWQVPQYFIMTLGECFFSVTGLSFAYSQAPMSMKSVLQAAWLLTNAFGNLIVLIISAAASIPSQTIEFLVFAGLMLVTVVIFAIMSLTYKYVEQDKEENEKPPLEGEVVANGGTLNAGYDSKSDAVGTDGVAPVGYKKREDTYL